ncbi:hypothetical protein IWQ61_002523 [Dispira simplex]|nr:hypothetical protein IWQ61_002523 [Dispira simplex]
MDFPPDYTVYQIQAPSFFSRTRHVIQKSTRRVVYTKRGPSSFSSRIIFYAPPGSPIYQPLEIAESLVTSETCQARRYLAQSPIRKAIPSWIQAESDGDRDDEWSVARGTGHAGNDETTALTASPAAEPWSTLFCHTMSPYSTGPRRTYTEMDWSYSRGSFSGQARDDRRNSENNEIDGLVESSGFRNADDYFSKREKEIVHRVLSQRLGDGRELSLALSVDKLLGSSIPMTIPSLEAPILWDVNTRRWRKQKCLLFINPRTTLGEWIQVTRDTWTDTKAIRYAFAWNEPSDRSAARDSPPPLVLPRHRSESPREGRGRQYLDNSLTGQDYRYGLSPPLRIRPQRVASPASSGHTPSSSPADTTTMEYPWHHGGDNGRHSDVMRNPPSHGTVREYYWKPESLSSQLVCYESSSGLPVARFRRKKLPFRYSGTVTVTDALVRSTEFLEFLLFSCLVISEVRDQR